MAQTQVSVTIDPDAILDELAQKDAYQQAWNDAIAIAQRRTKQKFHAPELKLRLEAAVELTEADAIYIDQSGRMWVKSQSREKQSYVVDQRPCACEDSRHGNAPGGYCKHRLAAYMYALTCQIADQMMDLHRQLHNGNPADQLELPPPQTPQAAPAPVGEPVDATYTLVNPPARATIKYRDKYGIEMLITLEARSDEELIERMKRYRKYVWHQAQAAKAHGIAQPGQESKGGSRNGNRSGNRPFCGKHKSPFYDNGNKGWGHNIKDGGGYCKATPEQVARFTQAA